MLLSNRKGVCPGCSWFDWLLIAPQHLVNHFLVICKGIQYLAVQYWIVKRHECPWVTIWALNKKPPFWSLSPIALELGLAALLLPSLLIQFTWHRQQEVKSHPTLRRQIISRCSTTSLESSNLVTLKPQLLFTLSKSLFKQHLVLTFRMMLVPFPFVLSLFFWINHLEHLW